MTSKVYFTDMRTKPDQSLMTKLDKLIRAAGIDQIDMEKKFVAIKMHFGEYGNLSFLRPNYAKVVADIVKEKGGMPYLVDCNTLYPGMRKNGIGHIANAEMNGFNSTTTGCNVFIGDGIKGTDDVEIPIINGEYCQTAKIGRAVADCDIIISLSHFKGHEVTGIGGALKNLGMGCASRRGKMELHSSGIAHIHEDKCKGCRRCEKHCGQSALKFDDKAKKMAVDGNLCAGCGRCIAMCPYDALYAEYDEKAEIINGKIVEYAKSLVDSRPNFHISFLSDVSPQCDCHSSNDSPIIPNVGIYASFDPVAIDLACVEEAQRQPMLPGTMLYCNCGGKKPNDIFGVTNKNTAWQAHFEHAKKIGMGDGSYEIVSID